MSAPLLTAAMIVRDEAEHLPGCLASLEGLADEIVIVDTGSRDDTVAIARRHGATVLHHPWNQDFSAPRNHGLDHAHGRWILCIDADERLRPLPRPQLEDLLQNAAETALMVRLHPVEGFTASLDHRLWRNDPRIRFRGGMHEKVVGALEEVARADGTSIGVCELTLDHVGYEGDQAHKHRRNLPMLEAALAADPGSVFNWRHLSQVLSGLGRPQEAERALERAVAAARIVHNEHGSAAWGDLARLRQERGEDVTELVAEGRARWPENWLLVWVEGHAHLAAGRREAAIASFRALLDVDPGSLPEHGVAYDRRLFGSWAHAALGLALFRAERYAEAARAYAAAERSEPGAAEHRIKRLLAESRVQSAREAAA